VSVRCWGGVGARTDIVRPKSGALWSSIRDPLGAGRLARSDSGVAEPELEDHRHSAPGSPRKEASSVLRGLAERWTALDVKVAALDEELEALVKQTAPNHTPAIIVSVATWTDDGRTLVLGVLLKETRLAWS
jgi:hypothetical protein